MKFAGHLIALGGMVFFGSTLAPGGQALAAGQHWRPAPVYPTVVGRLRAGIAKVPSFRPATVVQTGYEERSVRVEHVIQRPSRPTPPATRMPNGDMPGLARPHLVPPPWLTPPRWLPSFGNGMPGRHRMVPVYAPQFAVGRTELRWGEPRPPRLSTKVGPRTAALSTQRVRYLPTLSGWRPAFPAHRVPSAQPPAFQALSFRSVLAAVGDPGPARRAGVARQTLVGAQWRPAAAASPAGTSAFRPIASGRDSVDDRIAYRDLAGLDATTARPPGWVTTYREIGDPQVCGWCNGS